MKKTWALFVFASIFFLGCSQNSTQPPVVGDNFKNLSFAIPIPCHNSLSPQIKSAYAYISGNDFDTIISALSVSPCTLSGTVANIPVGKNRHIELKIFDKDNQLCYYGDSKANIEAGIATEVTIRLKSQTGNIIITGIIDDCDTGHTNINKPSLTGCWNITQSNNHWGMLELTQFGDSISGFSRFETHSDGMISGKVFVDSIYFRITYPSGDGYGDYYCKFSIYDSTSTFQGWGRGSDGQTATWEIIKGNCNDTLKFKSSCWAIVQSNQQIGTLQFTVIGDSISGFSRFSTHSNGPITGKLIGDSLIFRITYPAGDGYGEYHGKLGIYGDSIQGLGYGSNGLSAAWSATETYCD